MGETRTGGPELYAQMKRKAEAAHLALPDEGELIAHRVTDTQTGTVRYFWRIVRHQID